MAIDISALNWQKSPESLVPAIVQDCDTAKVLMLGYMNAEALEQTQRTKQVTFYSRSKKRLWTKGETSGNTLALIDIKIDCDADALLVQARPKGPTCHTGDQSCFGNEERALETIGVLMRTIAQRATSSDNVSYTKKLLDEGRAKYCAKILEEADEVVLAANVEGKERTIEESADLLYHFFVLLQGENISLEEVCKELRNRRKQE